MAKLTEDDYTRLCAEEGIVPVTIEIEGQKLPHWDNSGSGQDFTRFWCYVCMKDYATYEQRNVCRKSHTPEEEANPKQMQK